MAESVYYITDLADNYNFQWKWSAQVKYTSIFILRI